MLLAQGCGQEPVRAPAAAEKGDAAGQAYVTSPSVVRALATAAQVNLNGTAPAGAEVRLATPGGRSWTVRADKAGAWTLTMPRPGETQIFGLSMLTGGRRVQAQGYLLLASSGAAAMLRAGAGALRLDPMPAASIAAVDFDGGGGTVVSGTAPRGTAVTVRIGGRPGAEGRSDASGRYAIALAQPVAPGRHRVEAQGAGLRLAAEIEVTAAEPLGGAALRTSPASGGLRADWLTPGGGLQSTILLLDGRAG